MRRFLIRRRAWLVLLGLLGCKGSTPSGLPAWQQAFFDSEPGVEWGYRHADGYHRLGDARPLAPAERDELRGFLGTPLAGGHYKCIIHVDGRFTAGSTAIEVCTGCNLLLLNGLEYGVGPRDTLKRLMTSTLGPRPGEPADPSLEGF